MTHKDTALEIEDGESCRLVRYREKRRRESEERRKARNKNTARFRKVKKTVKRGGRI